MKRIISMALILALLCGVLSACSTLEDGDKGAIIDVYFTDENGNQVTDVNYFKDKGKMTFTGNINCYEGVNQVDLSSMDDVVYENTAN